MQSALLPPHPYVTTFPPTYLDLLPAEEPQSTAATQPTRPPSKHRPLAASPQPAAYYSQIKCPICKTHIADADGRNFIGNIACLHRGPCTNPKCIAAYYGVRDKWAFPYKGKKPLYCQAPGCRNREIKEWCLVECRLDPAYGCVRNNGTIHPNAMNEYEKAKEEQWAREKKEEKRLQKEKEKERARYHDNDTSTGSRCLDCIIALALCCTCGALLD
ncbi:hypothetical protein MMYC01_203432 [Madurella mycetomatis]|uniref:Uncharacterized protein n=1 Tax=Madurella mycetomatis TaxID=100816 RepID=A0A175W922_9PEZI|nr:hypothetical protein MMYC01_203432 [Madurella mycetomatis]